MSVLELFRLDGRVAIVTGGGRGLGEHMARGLAEAGAAVVLCSRKREACEEVAAEIAGAGGRALALACDVSEEADAARVVDATLEAFGRVDVLVNNSAVTWGAPPEEMPIEKLDQVLSVNVRGAFVMSQRAGRAMLEAGRGGSIINIASVAAFKAGRPGGLQAAGYAASKGAVISMTRDLAGSWADRGIRVNCIAPGWFPTRMSRAVLDRAGEQLLATIPLGRFGEADDIAGAAVFLASDASAYVTGHTLMVDGGQMVW
jgi:NAD(P)-dependent dehydrogenase (short-subunit alcohol dehydrogenase family)